jgi:hypothetical protein
MPTDRFGTIVFGEPVGLPEDASIEINGGSGIATSRTVRITPHGRGVYQVLFSEASDFSDKIATDWEDYSEEHSFTLSAGDGLKTVYCQMRNAGLSELEAAVSANITLAASYASGVDSAIFIKIIALLRADTHLLAYDTNWASATTPHVLPGWQSGEEEEPALGGHRSEARMPFIEVAVLSHSWDKQGTYFVGTLRFGIRAWKATGADTDSADRETAIPHFLWDIQEAVNASRTLDDMLVLEHWQENINPRKARGATYGCGQMDLVVRVGGDLQYGS